jgi:signal transduction histidine kinase
MSSETREDRVKCLLVDDLPDNLLALASLLRRDDVETLLAQSGAEALELLLEHDVALAFLDVQMPEMDGFELAELMRGSERTRHVPIIFVTAGARDQHRLFKGYDTGAVDFLYKPVEPHILQGKAEVFFQLHRTQRQLARQLQQLEETLRLNDMFTAVLGHDLRNPLHAIITTAHVLDRNADPFVRQCAARLLSSGRRMNGLVQDMLDFARARLGGGMPIRREPADLGEIASRVTEELRLAHAGRQIAIDAAGDLRGDWDAGRLAQVISNLVGNAIQHGEPDCVVDVRLDGREPGELVLAVSNAGSIPSHLLREIFNPFRGGSEPGESPQGLGLGLYIVQQIVHAHGGSVDVTSVDGRTTFVVRLGRCRSSD